VFLTISPKNHRCVDRPLNFTDLITVDRQYKDNETNCTKLKVSTLINNNNDCPMTRSQQTMLKVDLYKAIIYTVQFKYNNASMLEI